MRHAELKTIRDEAGVTIEANDVENLEYIITGQSFPTAVTAGHHHGGAIGPTDFDTGHLRFPLSEWMQMPQAKLAHLTEAELVAARFYTSSSLRRMKLLLRSLKGPSKNTDVAAASPTASYDLEECVEGDGRP